ncbi:DinB family protein [Ammoniphilus resinae]|uniref:Damage-inducible protein DinB n=1 Tax=Ammoniphilus resinae TaxID=861532 RepID=A0ABS4GVD4_9BACL|nr:DinB family protein [Ammoniphilus resinae]MBP1934231.1 putative damage-inducible protein DinB [Ammoniphilus resinae]
MTNEMLLRQVEVVRAITLHSLESITEDLADIMPKGFNNTIRWNVGHILIVQDQLASNFAGLPQQLSPEIVTLFGNRTRPSEWQIEPPTLKTLSDELKKQTVYIKESLGNRLQENAIKPFVRLGIKMDTIGEILSFSLHHEGMHTGVIHAIQRAISGSKN